jgi:hypothetical protein
MFLKWPPTSIYSRIRLNSRKNRNLKIMLTLKMIKRVKKVWKKNSQTISEDILYNHDMRRYPKCTNC